MKNYINKINWIPIKDLLDYNLALHENENILLYVNQNKMCARKHPEVLTGSIIDKKVKICYSHNIKDNKLHNLSEITHFTWLNTPWT